MGSIPITLKEQGEEAGVEPELLGGPHVSEGRGFCQGHSDAGEKE